MVKVKFIGKHKKIKGAVVAENGKQIDTIAIDGPAASGKTTIGQLLALKHVACRTSDQARQSIMCAGSHNRRYQRLHQRPTVPSSR